MDWKEAILACLITPFERLLGEMRKDQTLRANISLISAVDLCVAQWLCCRASGVFKSVQECSDMLRRDEEKIS